MTISKQELGARLKAAREANRMTQEAVAEKLGVSRSSIAQVEAGNRAVTSLELDRLAYLFGRDIRSFLADEPATEDPLAAIFRSEPESPEEEDFLEALRKSIAIGRELSNLEQLLGIDRTADPASAYPVPEPGSKWDAVQQGNRIADQERRRLGLGDAPLPNLAELLETQGIRTASQVLPDDISGLTLRERSIGLMVVVNEKHGMLRRRFSYAHEYCHALVDRDRSGIVSRSSESGLLVEVRANAFAASFLMPESGVRSFVRSLGKDRPPSRRAEVFDGDTGTTVQSRTPDTGRDIAYHDVVQVAHHFRVSRTAALYRLLNLDLIDKAELEEMLSMDQNGRGRDVRLLLGIEEAGGPRSHREPDHRFIGLGLEALRRDKITFAKLTELASMAGVGSRKVQASVSAMGLDTGDQEADILVPGG